MNYLKLTRPYFHILLLLFAGTAHAAQGGTLDPDALAGTVDEGKTYRTIDGDPITGKEVADLIVEERWENEVNDFVRETLVNEELEKLQLTISSAEEDAELARLTVEWARQNGKDVRNAKPIEWARASKVSPEYLREQVRNVLGLRKILVANKKITEAEALDPAKAQRQADAGQAWLATKVKEKEVVVDPKVLGDDSLALRVGGRPYSRDVLHSYIIRRMGPLTNRQLLDYLLALSYEHMIQKPLKEQKIGTVDSNGKVVLTPDELKFHLSHRVRVLEYDNKVPDGFEYFKALLQAKQAGMTIQKFMRERIFQYDAAVTALSKGDIHLKEIQAEWNANKAKYQREEKFVAQIFIVVRDPQGKKYTPRWQAPGFGKINELAGKVREEQFKDAKAKIDALVEKAKLDFHGTARACSEDDYTKHLEPAGKYPERIGANRNLQQPFDDAEFLQEVLKLKPGEVSAPLRSGYGWHLVKCLESQETSFEEAKEHIYVELITRRRQEVQKSFDDILMDKKRCVDFF